MIEKYNINEKGYHPFFVRDGWQVARLNYIDDCDINNIIRLDVHFETDEVFVLLKGEVVLISATFENDTPSFNTELMKQGTTYNIPKKVWHNIAMREGGEVLIVEKSNTHLGDYKFYYLNDKQIDELKNMVNCSFENK